MFRPPSDSTHRVSRSHQSFANSTVGYHRGTDSWGWDCGGQVAFQIASVCRVYGTDVRVMGAGAAADVRGPHHLLSFAQRFEGGAFARCDIAAGGGRGLLQHWISHRTQGSHRVRALVRTPDVRGFEESSEGRVRQTD